MKLALISEAAKTIADIKGNSLYVLFQPDAPSTKNSIEEPAPHILFNLVRGRPQDGSRGKLIGSVELEIPDGPDGQPAYDINTYAVHSEVPHGFGPLLYDLAAEYATMHGMGIMSASGVAQRLKQKTGHDYGRGRTSEQASSLWKKYGSRRDVTVTPGGPGYDIDNMHMTAPLRKPLRLLLQLSKLGLIVDRRGQVVDFTSA